MKKYVRIAISSFCLILLLHMNVSAANDIRVAGTYTNEDYISLYVKGFTSEINEIECQIGTKAGQQTDFEDAADMENAPRTLIMIDNSLSITTGNREKIGSFLTEYVDESDRKEQIAIATFDEELRMITDYTADNETLKSAIDTLTYQNQETYFTDVLYDVLAEGQLGMDDSYKKIIIISDGVDNKSIGYTRDELYTLIKEKSYPIYTLGCIYKSNEERLENMFALSRMTGGLSFLLDETENTGDLADAIRDDSRAVHIRVMPGSEEMDGSSRNILLMIRTSEGEQKVEAGIKMPFQAEIKQLEEVPFSEPSVEAPQEIAEPEPIVSEPEPVAKEKGSPVLYVGIGVAAVLLIAAIIIIIVLIRKKPGKENNNDFEVLHEEVTPVVRPDTDATLLLNNADDDKTQMIWNTAAKRYMLYLTDIRNPGRTFQTPVNGTVIIGRKAGEASLVIDYDKSVSGKHCQISERNSKFYVKDLQSSNGTLLNGVKILAEMEICSGCTLTLGRLEMKVEVRCE